MMRAIETKPMQRPVVVGDGHRALGLPSHDSKAAYFEALERKRLEDEAAIVKASTDAPLRPPVSSPAQRRKSTLDECLGFKPAQADPVADILFGRPRTAEPETEVKYAEPPLLHPRQAAIHGDAERAALLERPTRTVDEILFGVRRGTP